MPTILWRISALATAFFHLPAGRTLILQQRHKLIRIRLIRLVCRSIYNIVIQFRLQQQHLVLQGLLVALHLFLQTLRVFGLLAYFFFL